MTQSLSFYLSNGAIDVGVCLGVAMLIVQMTKGWLIDSWLAPSRDVHDYVVETYDLVVSLAIVYLLMWAGPGFHNRMDVVVAGLDTIIAVAAQFGIYAKLHPVPATPTASYVRHAQAHIPMVGVTASGLVVPDPTMQGRVPPTQ